MQRRNTTTTTTTILLSSLLLFFSLISITAMAEPETKVSSSSPASEATVHIVYTEQPEGDGPEAHHIRTLTTVLGSEEAAKEALVYTYSHAATGFSAKLTPEQVTELSKQPGVLQVVPSRTYQLHSGPAKLHSGPAKLHI